MTEKWTNGETDEPYWREPDNIAPTRIVQPWDVPEPTALHVVRVEPEPAQLPVSAPVPIEPSEAVLGGRGPYEPEPPNPRRLRAIARILRAALEGRDDAA